MTVLEFFGCGLLAFGSPLTLFVLTVAKEPIRIIICMSSAFFWLVSLLLSSLVWFAVPPWRDQLAFGMVFSVLFQEIFRYLLYRLLRMAERELDKVTERGAAVTSPHTMALVCGLGFGLMSGVFSMVNVLADSLGPATVGLGGAAGVYPTSPATATSATSNLFFAQSALFTLCFILLHALWSVVLHDALDRVRYVPVAGVVALHLTASSLTLLNSVGLAWLAAVAVIGILLLSAYWALLVAGGSLTSFSQLANYRRSARAAGQLTR